MEKKFTITLSSIFLCEMLLHVSVFSQAPNTWIQKADFGGIERTDAVAFSIGSKGYLGTGYVAIYKKDFWEYDPIANSWTQKADFGGASRYSAVGFSIDEKGYVGTGVDSSGVRSDFWEYDPVENTWTQKADFGGTPRLAAIGFSIDGKGYIGTGGNFFSLNNDFWEYDPGTNSWSEKASFAGTARADAVGFSINGKGYIGTGYDGQPNATKDFWEYDPTTDSWIQKADFGGHARYLAAGFSIGNRGYIGTGFTGFLKEDFWEYDSDANRWANKEDFGGGLRYGASGFSIGNKGYLGTGYYNGFFYKDFWEYTPEESCDAPSNLSTTNITSTTAILHWDAVSGADSYQVLYKTSGTPQWHLARPIGNEQILIGLAPNIEYAWKVKTVCNLSPLTLSEPSLPSIFTTAPMRLAEENAYTHIEILPNPILSLSTISFSLEEESHVAIELFDAAGKRLRIILDENLQAGNHEVILNRGDLTSGMYFLEVSTNDKSEKKKLMIE